MTVIYFNIVLLLLMLLVALDITRRQIFPAVILMSLVSLLSVLIFICMDAIDVAFTEAAVGAGISTILFLGALSATNQLNFQKNHLATDPNRSSQPILALLVVLSTAALLIFGVADIPGFSVSDNPVQQHVSPRYINDSPQEIGIPNMVTSVLASYRGYDTLGEVIVIFTAGIGVLLLLNYGPRPQKHAVDNLKSHLIEHAIAKLLIPFILLFALYVQFHGDYGPGGGFQAGVLFAAGFILYGLIFGIRALEQVIQPIWIQRLCAAGVLLYTGVGLAGLLNHSYFLDYNVLAKQSHDGQHLGIFLVELGVGITVFATMLCFFLAFNRK